MEGREEGREGGEALGEMGPGGTVERGRTNGYTPQGREGSRDGSEDEEEAEQEREGGRKKARDPLPVRMDQWQGPGI